MEFEGQEHLNIEQPENHVPDMDWSIMQHVGFFYKEDDESKTKKFDIYFNTTNAKFLASNVEDGRIVHLEVDIIKRDTLLVLDRANYILELYD